MPKAEKHRKILILTITVIALFLSLLRMYVVPPILDLETAVLSFCLIIIVIGAVAFYFVKDFVLFGVGLFILMFAFLSSLIVSVGTFGEDWRVVAILEANPDSYFQWITNTFLFGILPIAIGLVLCVAACIMQRKPPLENFRSMLLLILGGFFAVWGFHYYQVAYRDYLTATSGVGSQNINNIKDSLQTIYSAYELVGILWSITGVSFVIISFYALYKSRRLSKV